jgi:hypothetical protein
LKIVVCLQGLRIERVLVAKIMPVVSSIPFSRENALASVHEEGDKRELSKYLFAKQFF